jgi:electron transfer flavoprotein alpha subunit
MADEVLVVAEQADGKVSDTTLELLGQARELAGAWGGQAVVALLGDPAAAHELGAADLVLTADAPELAEYTSDAHERVLQAIIADRQPRLVLLSTATAGLDLAAGLSVACGAPLVSYVVGLEAEGDAVVATSQIYGGKMMAETLIEAAPALCAVIAGSFPADPGRGDGAAPTESVDHGAGDLRISFVGRTAPDASDVDITTADLLVAVGRGVGSEDDLELAQELADELGAPLAASRPVTDAGWLPKTRQVGKSGLKVTPKAYLMFGISGAPEHLEGMRDAELIIACNTDEQAPIFDVAHYGTTVDLFDLLPELTEKLES